MQVVDGTNQPSDREVRLLRARIRELEAAQARWEKPAQHLRLLSLAVEQSSEGLAVIDLDGNLLFSNQAFAEMHGYTPQELEGQHLSVFHTPAQMASVDAANRQIIETGTFSGEIWHVRRDGTEFPTRMRNTLLHDEAGTPFGIIGTARDITEQKRAEAALLESEDRYRDLVEHSSDLICIHDLEGQILSVNSAASHLLGYDMEKVQKMNIRDILVPEYRAELDRYLDRIRREGKAEGLMAVRTRTGERRIWEYNNTLRTEGVPEPVVRGMAHDVTEQVHAERALRRSEAQYRTTLDAIGDAIHVVDRELRIILLNKAFQKWQQRLGLEVKVEGKSLSQAFPFLSPAVLEQYHQVFETGEVLATTESTVIQDQTFLTETRKIPIFEDDRVFQVITVIRDVTQAKRREEALRDSEEMYRMLVKTSPDAVIMTDLTGTITFASPQAVDMYGGSEADEMVGRSALDFIAPQDHERALANMQRVLERGFLRDTEYALVQQDGSTYTGELNAALITDADGQPRAFIATSRDITARKQAEEELQSLKDFHQSIVQNMAEGIVVQDRDSYFTFVNPAAANLLGYTADELVGQYWTYIVPDDQQPIIEAADERRVRGEADRYEVELLHRNGQRIPVLISGRPRFKDGHFDGTLAVFTDISERIQAERETRRRTAQLEALREMGLELAAELNVDDLLHSIVSRAVELMEATAGGLYLYRPEQDLLVRSVSIGAYPPPIGTTRQRGEGLSGKVWQSGQPLTVADYRTWAGQAPTPGAPTPASVLGVPVCWGEEFLGVLTVSALPETERLFDEAGAELLNLFASQAAIAIENARLFEAERETRVQAETLQAATQALSATLDLQAVFELILSELRKVVPYDSATVQQIQGNDTVIIGGDGFPNLDELLGVRFDLTAQDNPNSEVVRTQAPHILQDAPVNYQEFQREPHAQALIRSWLGVPLLFGDRLIGMLALDKQVPSFYTAEHARLAMAFAAQAAIAIENARLFEAERAAREQAERNAAELRDREQHLTLLNDITRAALQTPNSKTMLHTLADRLADLLDADGCYITLWDEVQHMAIPTAATDPARQTYAGFAVRPGETTLTGSALAAGQALIVPDVFDTPYLSERIAAHFPVRSVLALPLIATDQKLGAAMIAFNRPHQFTADEVARGEQAAAQIALALAKAQLFEAEREQRELAQVLREVAQAIGASLELDETLRLLLDQLKRVLTYETASVLVIRKGNVPALITGAGYEQEQMTSREAEQLLRSSPILHQMAEDLQPVISDDVRHLPGWIWVPGAEHVRSWLGIPLVAQQKMIGALMVDHSQPAFYGDRDLRIAQALAQHAAQAIQNARMFQAERDQRELAEALRDATAAVSSTLDLEQVLDQILEQVHRVIPGDTANVMLIENGLARMVRWRGYERFDRQISSIGLPVADTPSLHHMRTTGQVIVIPDTTAYEGWVPSPEVAWLRSYVGAPIQARGQVIGFLNVDSTTANFFDRSHADLLRAFAAEASLAIEHARLYKAEQGRARQAARISQLAQALNAATDQESIYQVVAHQLHSLADFDRLSMALFGDDLQHFTMFALTADEDNPLGPGVTMPATATAAAADIQAGKPHLTVDLATETDFAGERALYEAGFRSRLNLPLRLGHKILGALNLASTRPGAFSPEQLPVLTQVADAVAAALQNTRLYEETSRHAGQMATLNRIGLAIASDLKLEDVLNTLHKQIDRIMDVGAFYVALYDPDSRLIHFPLLTGKTGPGNLAPLHIDENPGLTGHIIETGEPLYLPDTHNLPQDTVYSPIRPIDLPARSYIGVPLILRERVIGVLAIQSYEPKAYTEADVELLVTIATQATIAIENARLYEETLQRNRELTLLNRVIAASAASQEIEPILETVCRELALAFDVPQSAAALFNPEKTEAVVVAEYLTEGRLPSLGQTIPAVDNPSSQYILTHRQPFIAEDAQTDPRLAPIQDLMRQRGTVSLLILPLIVEDEVMGTLGIDAVEHRPFAPAEVNLARRVAEQASGSLARARLVAMQRRLSTAVEQAAEAVLITDTEGTILYVNPALEQITGAEPEQAIGLLPQRLGVGLPDEHFHHDMWQTVTSGQVWQGQFSGRKTDGTVFTVDSTVTPVRDKAGEVVNYVATLRDVTREVQLERQFHQSQKMEALGQLAGGIAHDFNNLLTVVHLSTQILQRQLHPQDPLWEHVQRIEETGERAKKLTKQLLSFSRREVIEPQVLNLNQIIGDLSRMLKRIIGEDIKLETQLTKDLWLVKADLSQMDQVILNLAINARDAMPRGGTLCIETSNVVLDQAYAESHMDAQSGDHVLLTISDSGMGMDEEVKAHLFEPFFTTKEPGQGSGLGLATVFGIVKQSGGHIRVHSKVGEGTTFRIYLPCTAEKGMEQPPSPSPLPSIPGGELLQGTETILVVEDKTEVRKLAADILSSCGYQVLTAGSGPEAIQLCQQYTEPIDLLLTDLVMPHMDGRELAEQLGPQRPEMRVLYMSGYADGAILQNGVLTPSTLFLSKPFTVEELTEKVRAVLDDQAYNSP